MTEQIEYHCPDCGSITPIMVGVIACVGCGKLLTLIQTEGNRMQTITLYTRDGREVTHVAIPPFLVPAEIIQWGARYFVRRDDGKYYEGMLWPVIE